MRGRQYAVAVEGVRPLGEGYVARRNDPELYHEGVCMSCVYVLSIGLVGSIIG